MATLVFSSSNDGFESDAGSSGVLCFLGPFWKKSRRLAIAASDNTVTIWDLSVEDDAENVAASARDANANAASAKLCADLPPQMLFVHQGLRDPKEVKHHPQIPGLLMTTAADGFNVFIPAL